MRLRAVPVALVTIVLTAQVCLAESVPFSCTIVDDGMAVRINVSNPANVARSCLVSCRFATPLWSSEAQIMCARMVLAGAHDIEICTKPSGGVQLLKETHAAADCIRR